MGRVFLVGYFVGKEDKMPFANLISGRDLYFLESSDKIRGGGNVIKVPQRLSGLEPRLLVRNLIKKPKIDRYAKSLYRKDLVAYFSNFDKPDKQIVKERGLIKRPIVMSLYCLALAQRVYRLRRCSNGVASSSLLAAVDFMKQFSFSQAFNYGKGRPIRYQLLKIGFVAGYNYYHKLVEKLNPTKGDLFMYWGTEYSGNLLLDSLTRDSGASTRVLEYGEIPGTVSVNREGIFGASDIANNWEEFNLLSINEQDRETTEAVLAEIGFRDAGSRGGGNGMFDVYRNMFDLNPARKKVVYVNGSELVASGHIYNDALFRDGLLNPNARLLERACETFALEDYLVIYKDHPMTMRQSKALALSEKDFPGVVFANSLNMKTLLELADVVITFPSKVVMTSLMMKVRTILVGRFTVPVEDVGMGLYAEEALADPSCLEQEIDGSRYVDFVARMLKYKLIKYDTQLFPDIDEQVERSKLLTLIN